MKSETVVGSRAAKPTRPLTIALPKGRILSELIPLLENAQIDTEPLKKDDRRLVIDTNDGAIQLVLLRPSDVPTYVAYGVADVGIAGSDTLIETSTDLLEPLDLGVGKCRLVVAGRADSEATGPWVRVATKYPNIARRHFRARGIEAIIIKLVGSVELAATAGLSDLVVDLVSTGETLRANGLVEHETILNISSRLVINRASLKTRHAQINTLIRAFSASREEQDTQALREGTKE